MIGLEKGKVRLSPYSAEWKRLFELEKISLQSALGSNILTIQHVGSTSIPGMPAKPIIDIGIAMADFEGARVCIPPIESLGYDYRGEFGIPRRHYFSKGDPRTHHIHMVEITSPAWENMLLFRDYLCQHAEIAQEYAQLKQGLAVQYPQDREAYLDGKTAFVNRVLALARMEDWRIFDGHARYGG